MSIYVQGKNSTGAVQVCSSVYLIRSGRPSIPFVSSRKVGFKDPIIAVILCLLHMSGGRSVPQIGCVDILFSKRPGFRCSIWCFGGMAPCHCNFPVGVNSSWMSETWTLVAVSSCSLPMRYWNFWSCHESGLRWGLCVVNSSSWLRSDLVTA